jgi:hypothetical protein
VGRLVLSGVASRIDLPVDRVDELGLALDTLAAWDARDGVLRLSIDVSAGGLRLTLGTFLSDPLGGGATRRVVSSLAGEVNALAAPGGHDVVVHVPPAR